MYVPADQACSGPTGRMPPSPQSVARDRAVRAMVQVQVNNGNAAMRGLVNRDWRDFQSLGPQVAWQVLNSPANGSAYGTKPGDGDTWVVALGSGAAGGGVDSSNPVGVDVGNSDSRSGGQRSWVPPQQRRKNGKNTTAQEKAAFVGAFGGQLTPWQEYTGPLPATGTSMSQVYGGSPSNRSTSFGAPAPVTPDAATGYYQSGSCPPMPQGVNAFPLGEPIDQASGGTGAGTSDSNGTLWLIAALVGLAGLSFLGEKHEQRKRRKAAAK